MSCFCDILEVYAFYFFQHGGRTFEEIMDEFAVIGDALKTTWKILVMPWKNMKI